MTMTGIRLMAVAVGWAITSAAPVRADDKNSSAIEVGGAKPQDDPLPSRGASTTSIGQSAEQTTPNVEISRPASISPVSGVTASPTSAIPSIPVTTTTYGGGAAPAAPTVPATAPSVGSSIPSSLMTGSSSMHF